LTAAEAELAFDPLVGAPNITVENMGGEVALNVHNHLEVVLPPGDHRDDAMLTTSAINALELNVTVPAGVQAIAQDGNFTLAGTTPTRRMVRLRVEEALSRHSLLRDNSDVTVDTDLNTVRLTGHVRTR